MNDRERPIHVGQLNFPECDRLLEAIDGIFERRHYANHGPLERELDRRLAERLGVRHAVSVTNGTVAIMLLLSCLELEGDVIVPSFTFPGTVQALSWCGLEPVFCDVDPVTHNLSAELVEPLIRPGRTAAVLGVHLWGRPCDPDGLEALCARYQIPLLFDAAHGFGCEHRGRPVGNFGLAETFSMHATKVLNGAEGGCITTNSDELADRLRTSRTFHETEARAAVPLRLNAKISEMQAAIALCSLDELDRNIADNRARYERYRERITGLPGVRFVDYAGDEPNNYQYIVAEVQAAPGAPDRDGLLEALKGRGILARRYFYPGVHRAEPYASSPCGQVELPSTDELVRRLFQLPTGKDLQLAEVDRICDALRDVLT